MSGTFTDRLQAPLGAWVTTLNIGQKPSAWASISVSFGQNAGIHKGSREREVSKGGEERPPKPSATPPSAEHLWLPSPQYLNVGDTLILQAPQGARGQKGPQLSVLQGHQVHQP